MKVDRLGREGVRLASPCLTLLWALQPDALEMLLDEHSLQQGGFLARCLLAHTHAEPQHIGSEARPISDDSRSGWESIVRDLLTAYRQPASADAGRMVDVSQSENPVKRHITQSTPEARGQLETYYNAIVDRRKAGEFLDVSQYASRWCEQAARLAITLHAGLYGAAAHQHLLSLETAHKAIRLAKWFANQQLGLLTKGRRAGARKAQDEVLQLLKDRAQGRHLERNERELGHPIDYLTARTVQRARIATDPAKAVALLSRRRRQGHSNFPAQHKPRAGIERKNVK